MGPDHAGSNHLEVKIQFFLFYFTNRVPVPGTGTGFETVQNNVPGINTGKNGAESYEIFFFSLAPYFLEFSTKIK
jgi:hypothetical protein